MRNYNIYIGSVAFFNSHVNSLDSSQVSYFFDLVKINDCCKSSLSWYCRYCS